MTKEDIAKLRNSFLSEIKKEKSDEYKTGYVDGVLDMYNETTKLLEVKDAI